jgi:CubicO group peptidase (beta-lactamase class C family)
MRDGVDRQRLGELVSRARRDVDAGSVPSCQLAVAYQGEVVAAETLGDAGADDRYVLFSVTKAIVAAAVWLLIGDGRLDPAAPVAAVVPEFATNGKDVITAEHLLTHTSGIPRAPLGPPAWLDRNSRLATFARWRLNWDPGTRCEYHATSAHWVLAELIERLSGCDYRQFVAERLARPLGLHSLRLGVPEPEQHDIRPLVTCGAPPRPEELALLGLPSGVLDEITHANLLRFNDPEVRALGVPGAGAVAGAADVARLYQALLENPGRLFDPAVLAEGTRRVRVRLEDPIVGGPALRTLGLVVAGDDGRSVRRGFGTTCSPQAFGHSGVGGQLAWADPATGVSFCYLTNGLDVNLLSEGRRRAALSNRAGALVASVGAPDPPQGD